MRRIFLTSAVALLAFLSLTPSAWAEWVWPLRGEVITPYRNGADPYAAGQHRGIDIAGAPGATVVAAASGEVRFAGTAGSSGLTVSVRTGDGRYDTSYLHLSATTVREGDRVAAGDRVGAVGTTGTRSAAAPHLHFGVRDAASRHTYHDPLAFLPPPTATQPPREVPAPQPSPVPVGPAPAPVPAPAPSPRRVPTGAPRRVPLPAPSPRRVPAGAPRRVPAPAPGPRHVPSGARGPVPGGAPRPVPAATPRPVPGEALSPLEGPATPTHPGEAAAGAPGQGRAHVPWPSDDSASPNASGQAAQPGADPDHGPLAASSGPAPRGNVSPGEATSHLAPAARPGADLGLALACLGLVAAAALLGLTRNGQKATSATRHRIAGVLHPILGRR
jgi:hypothetical protein